MRAALLVASCLAILACEDEGLQNDPDGGKLPPPVAGTAECAFGAQPGDPCALAAGSSCFMAVKLRDCLAAVKRCQCAGGKLSCEPLSRQAACIGGVLADGYACTADGPPFCTRQDPGGSCTCKARAWSCKYACPEGCPGEAPRTGNSCSLADLRCPYDFEFACTCAGGRWSCS